MMSNMSLIGSAEPKRTQPKRISYLRPKSVPFPKDIARLHAQAKPKSKPKTQPKTRVNPKPKVKANPKPKTQPKTRATSKPKAKARATSKTRATPKPKIDTKIIPSATRTKVWRKWCGNVMDGKCFCCEKDIFYEKWHCGHIIARNKGGSIEEENLRPTCIDCNLGMGTMHLYEWIMMNRLPGVRHLSLSDPVVKFQLTVVEATVKTGEKIDWLEEHKHLTKTSANGYRRRIISKRSDTIRRTEVMEEVAEKYQSFQ